MRITWEVEDGYVGKSRPQHLEIGDEELDDIIDQFDGRVEDIMKEIDWYVQEDFEQKVTWTYSDYSYKELESEIERRINKYNETM